MLTFRTALPARFSEEDALSRRFTEAWLATGTVPVAHIVEDPDTFDDDATCTVPARRGQGDRSRRRPSRGPR